MHTWLLPLHIHIHTRTHTYTHILAVTLIVCIVIRVLFSLCSANTPYRPGAPPAIALCTAACCGPMSGWPPGAPGSAGGWASRGGGNEGGGGGNSMEEKRAEGSEELWMGEGRGPRRRVWEYARGLQVRTWCGGTRMQLSAEAICRATPPFTRRPQPFPARHPPPSSFHPHPSGPLTACSRWGLWWWWPPCRPPSLATWCAPPAWANRGSVARPSSPLASPAAVAASAAVAVAVAAAAVEAVVEAAVTEVVAAPSLVRGAGQQATVLVTRARAAAAAPRLAKAAREAAAGRAAWWFSACEARTHLG